MRGWLFRGECSRQREPERDSAPRGNEGVWLERGVGEVHWEHLHVLVRLTFVPVRWKPEQDS